ncbi:MAG TPA: transcription-repair coupling factor [Blastocatellia bacterium]|nr:transcription-repair coupling factor [Blastocatellia bacterium]
MSIDTPPETYYAEIFGQLLRSEELERLAEEARAGHKVVVLSGLSGSARALVLAALEKKLKRRIVFVTRSNREVEEFQPDLELFYCAINGLNSCETSVLQIPALESNPYDGTSPHAEVLERRALALYRAARGDARILLTSITALAERTISPGALKSSSLVLRAGEDMPPELIVDLLIASGYVRQEPVGAVGEFSLRGGILDIFSPAHDAPHRIEFFGDTVDSIRQFDADTQRSTGQAGESVIVPMRELSVRREEFIDWADAARGNWADERFRRDLRARVAHAERGEPFPGWEYLIPLTRPLASSAFDYLKDALAVIDEPAEIEKSASDLYSYLRDRFLEAEDSGELALPPERLFLTPEELRERFHAAPRVEFRLLGRAAASTDEQFRIDSLTRLSPPESAGAPAGPRAGEEKESGGSSGVPDEINDQIDDEINKEMSNEAGRWAARASRKAAPSLFLFTIPEASPDISIISQSPRRYHGRVQDLARDLASDPQARERMTLFAMPSLGLAERVTEMLGEYEVTAQLLPSLNPRERAEGDPPALASSRVVTVGRVSNGFTLPAARLRVLTEGDIFGEVERAAAPRPVPKRARKQRKASAFLSDLGDLKVGDYVVHVDHGIGQFQGLKQIATAGGPTGNVAAGIERAASGEREFMLLTFAEGAKLYVPVERLDLVQRYSAGEGHKPTLDRLGGVSWEKAKARVKRAMRDMAEELLKLYAERQLVGGHAYSPDTPWQQEFEDAFEYQMTPDQESAIEDVKAGMENPQPMDRLIVGDVGYGKTEVAMRAAFKAVMEGKQVAVLAPTTVLVFQHFKTFQQRFSAFPARIEMLSRFRTVREQKEVLKSLEAGTVDIVIGTHRLLSKDIRFKDLGLLIVDEEQRFGVAHKERIKQMRKKVDVISMSATPIPRTLNMSLAGLRDMSVIETPPRDRLAIQTQVVQFSEPVIRSAIELELQRGGQAFFVHNRVETIFTIGELIGRLVPEARVGVAHGQMGEKDLENILLKFIRHELDVLVSTTIIENGIDIPLANTIIINRADAYGLSQLYQLRGRVGRSNRRAYAYLLIPSEEGLTDIARRRLAAIREFSELGAGFRIAALDLELRGAGNLLGGQQSGHIDAVGFDLYTQMLERTVRELKGEPIEDEVSTIINIGVDIRIPEEYIYDVSQRLRTYKRISSAESDEELADISAEIEDRYGPMVESVENLFEYARLRRETSRLGIISIDREGDRLAIKFREQAGIDPEKLVALVSGGEATFTPAGVLKLRLRSQEDRAIFAEVRALLDRLK